MKSHVDEFNKILMDLENLEIKIDDEDDALWLLCSLPSSYKNFWERLIYGGETIIIEDVKASHFLIDLMDRELVGSIDDRQGEALVARGSIDHMCR